METAETYKAVITFNIVLDNIRGSEPRRIKKCRKRILHHLTKQLDRTLPVLISQINQRHIVAGDVIITQKDAGLVNITQNKEE